MTTPLFHNLLHDNQIKTINILLNLPAFTRVVNNRLLLCEQFFRCNSAMTRITHPVWHLCWILTICSHMTVFSSYITEAMMNILFYVVTWIVLTIAYSINRLLQKYLGPVSAIDLLPLQICGCIVIILCINSIHRPCMGQWMNPPPLRIF